MSGGALLVPIPSCQNNQGGEKEEKKHSPLCDLDDEMSWSHAGGGDRYHAATVLAGAWEWGGGGTERPPVSRLHRAGYHTVGGVR